MAANEAKDPNFYCYFMHVFKGGREDSGTCLVIDYGHSGTNGQSEPG